MQLVRGTAMDTSALHCVRPRLIPHQKENDAGRAARAGPVLQLYKLLTPCIGTRVTRPARARYSGTQGAGVRRVRSAHKIKKAPKDALGVPQKSNPLSCVRDGGRELGPDGALTTNATRKSPTLPRRPLPLKAVKGTTCTCHPSASKATHDAVL